MQHIKASFQFHNSERILYMYVDNTSSRCIVARKVYKIPIYLNTEINI